MSSRSITWVMLVALLAGCADGGGLSAKEVDALVAAAIAAERKPPAYSFLDLDGELEVRIDGGPWGPPVDIHEGFELLHGGDGLLQLPTGPTRLVEWRYTGNVTGLRGHWSLRTTYASATADLDGDTSIAWSGPGTSSAVLFLSDENGTHAMLVAGMAWDISWTVHGALERPGIGTPDHHRFHVPPAATRSLVIDVAAIDEPEVQGRKASLQAGEGHGAVCGRPDLEPLVESTDHILAFEGWMAEALTVTYGHRVPDCGDDVTVVVPQSIEYRLRIDSNSYWVLYH